MAGHGTRTAAICGATFFLAASGGDAMAIEAGYDCSGSTKLTAQFSAPQAGKGSVVLAFANGRRITLPQVLSADGGRYAEGDVEFWIKGRGATLTRGSARETCKTR